MIRSDRSPAGRGRRLIPLLLVGLALAAPTAQAQAPVSAGTLAAPVPAAAPARAAPASGGRPAVAPATRARIGLALSGGGARGFAHVGVLRALEALRIPVDCIAGTSAGSAVGAAYASGLSPDEIERALRSADWDRDLFDDAPPRRDQQTRRKNEEKAYLLDITVGVRDGSVLVPSGLIAGQKVELFLHRMLGSSLVLDSFDRLPIPFRAMATDLESAEAVAQDRGSLVTAVRASMAVPSIFAPVEAGGRLLVDGGLTRNMPVDVVRTMCADVVIAVDIGSPLLTRADLGNAFGIASQMIGVLMERNMRESRAELRAGVDVMIRPELGDIGATSFSRGADGIPAGERATLQAADALAPLAVDPTAYAAWQVERRQRRPGAQAYAGVRMIGPDPATARTLLAQGQVPPAGPLDRPRLERAINRWNSTGDYDRIGYALVPDATAGTVLEIEAIERAWGPNFVRFGLGASSDSEHNGVFNLLLGYRRPGITPWGGEFKAETQFGTVGRLAVELFQPLSRGDARFYVAPKLLWQESPLWLFLGRQRIAEYGLRTTEVGLDAGVQGWLGDVRLGVFGGTRRTELRTGLPLFTDSHSDHAGVELAMLVDQLDATDFPREGTLAGLRTRHERVSPAAGGDFDSHRLDVFAKQVGSIGPHTLALSVRLGETSDRVDAGQFFMLGGFMNLSGLQNQQILGRSLRYGSLAYQYQLLTLPNPLGRGVYAGVALEAARMRRLALPAFASDDWIPAVTAYLGAHTVVGPVYLGYGAARGDNRLLYLFLGRPGF